MAGDGSRQLATGDWRLATQTRLATEAANAVRWYALYTCSRHEKQVVQHLERRGVEHFLPLYASVRRWKDRRMNLELPLFPGYVFVHMELRNRVPVLQVPGVVKLVGTSGQATALSDDEIETIRKSLEGKLRVSRHPYLKAGRRVRVCRGPLAGSQGILKRWKGGLRLVIALDAILQAMAVEVDAADVEPI